MKCLMSLFLLLLIINFLPCHAMQKERVSIHTNNALKKAVRENNHLIVHKALKNSANINAQDQDGNSALHYAMYNGNFSIIHTLHKANANSFIDNKYRNSPLLYLNIDMPLFEQSIVIADATKKGISRQMYNDLKKNNEVNQEKLNKVHDHDELAELFNKVIGKEETKYYPIFYKDFLRQVNTFILLALEDKTKKVATTLDLDPLLPYFDLSLAQKKASQLIQILKIMNTISLNFFKKSLSISEKVYTFHFNRLPELTKDGTTSLIALYIYQIKTIVDDPIFYKRDTNKKITRAYNLYAAERSQWLASTFIRIATLSQEKAYKFKQEWAHLPSFDQDKVRMLKIVNNAPGSSIKPKQFALAFTSFAYHREFAEKSQRLAFRIVNLLQKGAYFPSFYHDKQRMQLIVDKAPKSNISPEQFALAFTSFAQSRKKITKELSWKI